jgi:PKD repeat protein
MKTIGTLSLLGVGLSLSLVTWAGDFPVTAGVEHTPSLGQFAVRLTKEAGEKFGLSNCPGDWDNPDDPCVIWSPVLAEEMTRIGRSAPHNEDDNTDEVTGAAIGCDVGQDGCLSTGLMPELVKDGDLKPFPEKGFVEGPANTKEVHTQILSLNMIDQDEKCTRPDGTSPVSANAVRAGSAMTVVPSGERKRSLGEVESLNDPAGNFPAESFFNMFIEAALDWNRDGNVDMTVYNPIIPLTVQNSELKWFPPKVVYIHGGNTNDGAPPVYEVTTGELIGWIILAGHGVGCIPSPDNCSSCGRRNFFAQELRNILASDPLILKRYPMPLPPITPPPMPLPPITPPPTPLPPPSPPLEPLTSTMNLTINFGGTGHGHVTTDPSGIDCDSSQAKCSHSYETATWINLIPTAAADSQFTGWSGYQSDCDNGELFMSGARFCTVYFERLRFPLIITIMGKGKVSSEPRGINCGTQCQHVFDIDTNVTLTAAPKKGWQFQGWNGDCDQKGSVVINKNKACQATFVSGVDAGTDKVLYPEEETTFAAAIIDNGLNYQWDFGDGNTANTASASHTYTATGTYTATLTVTDGQDPVGNDTLTVEVIKDSGIEIPQDVLKEIKDKGYAKIILSFNLATQPEGELSTPTAILDQRTRIAQVQQQFINSLLTSQINSPTGDQNLASPTLFTTIPYLAMGVNAIQLAHIRRNPLVTRIELDKLLIGGLNVPENGSVGANQTIAILDTGVDSTHPNLAARVISAACYSTTYAPYSSTTLCPGGNDEQVGTGAAIPCTLSGCEHGTQVAETVANEADLIAIQVFSRIDDADYCDPYPSPCIKSFSSDQLRALERVLILHGSGYPLATVTINLDGEDASDYCESPARQAIIANLHSIGITTIITSGNDDYSNSESASTCLSAAPNFEATEPSSDTQEHGGLTEPLVTDSQAISFSSLPPETPPCYASGLIDWVCNANGQKLTDLTVGPNGMIAYGTLVGTLTNQGRVSNLTLEPQSHITGGIVTGYILNRGEMANFEFRGAAIVGGVLAGDIFNTSQVCGYFRDVQLAAGTHLRGGQLAGEISGEVQAPALLEDLEIEAGSHLEYVTIGDGVKLAANITLGEGVQFNHPSEDPRLVPKQLLESVACNTDLPSLGVTAIDATGQVIETQCQCTGGVAVNGGSFEPTVKMRLADTVEIRGTVCVAPEQLGQLADLVVYLDYQPLNATAEEKQHYMLDSSGEVLPWDGQVVYLIAFQQTMLAAVQEVLLYQGQLATTGKLNLFFGYRLMDGTLISNEQAIEITITD